MKSRLNLIPLSPRLLSTYKNDSHTHTNIIPPVFPYGCETWCHFVGRTQAEDNLCIKSVFGTKEGRGSAQAINNWVTRSFMVCNLHGALLEWASEYSWGGQDRTGQDRTGHVACAEENRHAQRTLVGNLTERDHLEDTEVDRSSS